MPPEVMIVVCGVFVTVAVTVGWATSAWLASRSPELRRLHALAHAPAASVVRDTGPLAEGLDPVMARLSRLVPRSPSDMTRLQRRLTRAGYPRRQAAVYFSLAELLLPLLLGGSALLFLGATDGWTFAIVAAAVGFILPNQLVKQRTKARQKAIRNGLPDTLDLLALCVEAGSGLDQAIVKATEDLQIVHPVLTYELKLVTTEVRAGKPRLDAFADFADRTGVDEVRTLVGMLRQTDQFGTNIGEALRIHADNWRVRRRQRAEERAGLIGIKLVFPLAFFLFPALYVVCFGPIVVRIFRVLLAGSL